MSFTLYTLTSLSIFSIHILRCWQGQFIESWIKSLRKVKLSLLGVNGLDLSQWLSYRLIHVGCTIQTSFDIIYPNHVILKQTSATLILRTVKMILHSNYLFINDQNIIQCWNVMHISFFTLFHEFIIDDRLKYIGKHQMPWEIEKSPIPGSPVILRH